jgi:hypothetical protein
MATLLMYLASILLRRPYVLLVYGMNAVAVGLLLSGAGIWRDDFMARCIWRSLYPFCLNVYILTPGKYPKEHLQYHDKIFYDDLQYLQLEQQMQVHHQLNGVHYTGSSYSITTPIFHFMWCFNTQTTTIKSNSTPNKDYWFAKHIKNS